MPHPDLASQFLTDCKRLFIYYKFLGEKAIQQIDNRQLFQALDSDCNSIAIIIKHLHGNMMSRWTNFLNSDGEKSWRQRDQEFEDPPQDRAELMNLWDTAWHCLFSSLDQLDPPQLMDIIYIRNEGHTVMEAIHRQLSHYSYHIGQIVYIAKWYKGTKWENLSIPKNASSQYNTERFDKRRQMKHFTKR